MLGIAQDIASKSGNNADWNPAAQTLTTNLVGAKHSAECVDARLVLMRQHEATCPSLATLWIGTIHSEDLKAGSAVKAPQTQGTLVGLSIGLKTGD